MEKLEKIIRFAVKVKTLTLLDLDTIWDAQVRIVYSLMLIGQSSLCKSMLRSETVLTNLIGYHKARSKFFKCTNISSILLMLVQGAKAWKFLC